MRKTLLVVLLLLGYSSLVCGQTVSADRFKLNTGPCYERSGTGSPEGVVTGNPCDKWRQTDSPYAEWRKTSGTGNTGWVAISSTTGTVTSVGATLGHVSFTGPVTTAGTLAGTWNTQIMNRIFAGPASGVDAIPTWRALVANDLPSDLNTGTTIGSAYIYRAAGTDVPLADGGTNASLTAAHGAVPYSTASAFGLVAPGNAGQIFQSAGAASPVWTTPSALTKTDDTNVTLTLGGTPATALLQAASITAGWIGTLADARIASAATWNAKEPAIAAGTTAQYWRGDKSWQTLQTSVVPEVTNLYYTDARARAAVSSSATGLTYTSGTGVFSLTSGYMIPGGGSAGQWLKSNVGSAPTFGAIPAADIAAGTFGAGAWVFTGDVATNGGISSSLIPTATDTYNLGSYAKLWSQGYLSKLNAIVFALNTQTLFGGYSTIGYGAGAFGADVAAADTTINFGTSMTSYVGDWIVVRSTTTAGVITAEYLLIGTLVSGTTYNVTRDLAGINIPDPAWPKGTPYLILGHSGTGRLDLFAYDGKPKFSMATQGATYGASTEYVRIGDLEGMLSIPANKVGIALGDATSYLKFYDGVLTIAGNGAGLTSINGGNIQTDTITATQIAANAITTSELNADSVTSAKIVAGTIVASDIAALTITAAEIAASTITAAKMNVTDLSAITANLGTITAGSISVVNGVNTIGLTPAGANAIFAGPTGAPTFAVTPAGALVATNAAITGTVNAASGAVILDSGGAAVTTTDCADCSATDFNVLNAYKFTPLAYVPGAGYGLFAKSTTQGQRYRYLGLRNITTNISSYVQTILTADNSAGTYARILLTTTAADAGNAGTISLQAAGGVGAVGPFSVTGSITGSAGMALSGGAVSTAGLVLPSAVPGVTTNTLYASGTTLYWNGTPVGTGTGYISGSGTAGKLPKFSAATVLADSLVSESGSTVTVTGVLSVTSTAGASNLSGTNTGDNATNTQYSGLVTNATHTGDATGSGALTVVALNGTNLAALGTGLMRNTTATGVPTIVTDASANWNTAYTDTNAATSANTVSTIVKRDASGNFSAGTITAALTGAASGNEPSGAVATHAALTTTAHGLGASAFHADAFFAPAAGSSSIVTVGTITSGVWNAGAVTSSGSVTTGTGSYIRSFGQIFSVGGMAAGNLRWDIEPVGAESGSNVGSDYTIYRYSDAGAYLGTALTLTRATSAATFAAGVSATTGSFSGAGDSYFTGKLGIGLTNPGNQLTLAGASATPGLRLGSTSTTYYWDIGRENATTGDFVFNSAQGGAATEWMRIKTTTGNVGIKTTGPNYTLDVNGTLGVSGQLTSTVVTGTAPLVVSSTTQVANLNAATAGNASTVTTNANLMGDVTSTGNATAIAAGVIVDADVNAAAGIVDTKLATIVTAGKVSDSALSSNVPLKNGTNNFTNENTIIRGAIGVTSTDALTLTNTTSAALNAQQWSPRLHWTGQGYKTDAVAVSQNVDVLTELRTVQGAAAATGVLGFAARVSGGAYSDIFTLTTAGVGAFTGALTASNLSGTNTGNQVVPANEVGAASNFLTAYNSGTGAWTKAQPTWANVDKTTSSLADLATRAVANLSDGSNVALLNVANAFTAFGTHTWSAGGTGSNILAIRNTAAGTGNRAEVYIGNNLASYEGVLSTYSSTFSTSGSEIADSLRVASFGVNGLSLAAIDASGDVRIYSRNVLAATWGASGALTNVGTINGLTIASGVVTGGTWNAGAVTSSGAVTGAAGQFGSATAANTLYTQTANGNYHQRWYNAAGASAFAAYLSSGGTNLTFDGSTGSVTFTSAGGVNAGAVTSSGLVTAAFNSGRFIANDTSGANEASLYLQNNGTLTWAVQSLSGASNAFRLYNQGTGAAALTIAAATSAATFAAGVSATTGSFSGAGDSYFTGKLGIGLTNPGNQLTLAGASATPGLRLGSTSTTYYWDIGRENATTGDFVFNSAQGGAATEWMRIKTTTGNVGIKTTGPNYTLDVNGTLGVAGTSTTAAIVPVTTGLYSLGTSALKWSTLDVLELRAAVMAIKETIVASGGSLLVTNGTALTTAAAAADTTIYVKHNSLASGDFMVLQTPGQFEVIKITSVPSGTGPYSYTVTRNQDGTGANNWAVGDGLVSIGATAGQGWAEHYAGMGNARNDSIDGLGIGPASLYMSRTGTAWNNYATYAKVGNLNGHYGYATNLYGLCSGDYAAASICTDATNGVRFRNNGTTVAQFDTTGLTLTLPADYADINAYRFQAAAGATGSVYGLYAQQTAVTYYRYLALRNIVTSDTDAQVILAASNSLGLAPVIAVTANRTTNGGLGHIVLNAGTGGDVTLSGTTVALNAAVTTNSTVAVTSYLRLGTATDSKPLAIRSAVDGTITIHFSGNTSSTLLSFYAGATGDTIQGSITQNNAGAVAYNTSSDRRLKRDFTPTRYGLADLLKLSVTDFSFIADPARVRTTGLVAQDVWAIYPEAVTRPAAPDDVWMMDYGKLTPLLVQSVQDVDQRLVATEARIAALEAELKSLKEKR